MEERNKKILNKLNNFTKDVCEKNEFKVKNEFFSLSGENVIEYISFDINTYENFIYIHEISLIERNKGIGSKFLNTMKEIIKEFNFDYIKLMPTFISFLFYLKHGFKFSTVFFENEKVYDDIDFDICVDNNIYNYFKKEYVYDLIFKFFKEKPKFLDKQYLINLYDLSEVNFNQIKNLNFDVTEKTKLIHGYKFMNMLFESYLTDNMIWLKDW